MLGKKLAKYRRDAGYTQHQLGELLNVSAQAVSKWENDQAEPDLHTLRRLCLIYKIKWMICSKKKSPKSRNPKRKRFCRLLSPYPSRRHLRRGGGGFSRREKGFRTYS